MRLDQHRGFCGIAGDGRLALGDADQGDDAGSDLFPEVFGDAAQTLAVHAVQHAGHQLDAVDLLRRRRRARAAAQGQLATAQAVYLIQLAWMPFGPDLAALLANPAQVKAGVGIRDDMRDLAKLHDFEPAGLVDLGGVARAHKLLSQGLRSLTANFFGWRISKGSQCSNWSLPELSAKQIAYAATDAWIGRLIFMRMCELGLIPTTRPATWPVGASGGGA